jgi:hypothetical protein
MTADHYTGAGKAGAHGSMEKDRSNAAAQITITSGPGVA